MPLHVARAKPSHVPEGPPAPLASSRYDTLAASTRQRSVTAGGPTYTMVDDGYADGVATGARDASAAAAAPPHAHASAAAANARVRQALCAALKQEKLGYEAGMSRSPHTTEKPVCRYETQMSTYNGKKSFSAMARKVRRIEECAAGAHARTPSHS